MKVVRPSLENLISAGRRGQALQSAMLLEAVLKRGRVMVVAGIVAVASLA